MKSMLFAAGLGTRLRPLTDTRPKALVEVGDRTLLDIVVNRLYRAGAEKVVVNVHHHAQMLRDYIATHPFPLPIRISDESDALLNTGGGLRRAIPLFDGETEPILLHNVDILSNADLPSLMQSAQGAAATLLVSERKTTRYLLFSNDGLLMGWTNISTGEVRSPYHNLNPSNCRAYAFSGIHAFSPSLFPALQSYPEETYQDSSEAFSIVDFYLSLCHKHPIRAALQPKLKVLDVGKPETLPLAADFLRRHEY